MKSDSPIGVFDSGLGGLSGVAKLHELLPHEDILFFGDSAHNPYGTKTKDMITAYCLEIVTNLQKAGCKAVVIACNTATSAAVPLLRETFDFPIIGMEPALKLAASYGDHQKIAVWATRLTLEEEKFAHLRARFTNDHDIRSVPCPKLVRLVEEDRLHDDKLVRSVLQDYLDQSDWKTLDAIVLGCTHFVFFKNILEEMTDHKVRIVDGNEGTVRHLEDILARSGLLNEYGGSIHIDNSMPDKIEQSEKLLKALEE